MDRGEQYFVANLKKKKKPNSWTFCCWQAGIYSYIKMYTVLVISMQRCQLALAKASKSCLVQSCPVSLAAHVATSKKHLGN